MHACNIRLVRMIGPVLRLVAVLAYVVCQLPCVCAPLYFGKCFFPAAHRFNHYLRELIPPLSTGVLLLFFSINLSTQLTSKFPSRKPGVTRFLLMTHSSTLDFMVVTTAVWLVHRLMGSLVCIVKQELLNMPLMGMLQRGVGSIPVARSGDLEAAKRNLAIGEARAREGYAIAGFPEGSRRRSPSTGRDQLLPFKKGMFHMAKNLTTDGTKIQFIPLVMVGGNTAWPSKSLLPIPGSKVTVRIGEAIDMKNGESVDQMVVRVRERMQDEIERTGAIKKDGSYSVEAAHAKGEEVNLWAVYGLEAVLLTVPGLTVAYLALSGML